MIGSSLIGTVGGEIVVVVAIALLLYVVYRVGKSLLKMLVGIVVNSVLGLAVLYFANMFFNLGISSILRYYILIPVALFGLPGAGTIIILRFAGIPL